MLLFFKFNY